LCLVPVELVGSAPNGAARAWKESSWFFQEERAFNEVNHHLCRWSSSALAKYADALRRISFALSVRSPPFELLEPISLIRRNRLNRCPPPSPTAMGAVPVAQAPGAQHAPGPPLDTSPSSQVLEPPRNPGRFRLLNQSTHSSVANSTPSMFRHGPRRLMASVLKSPMTVLASALS
jgi:hypothetical protein